MSPADPRDQKDWAFEIYPPSKDMGTACAGTEPQCHLGGVPTVGEDEKMSHICYDGKIRPYPAVLCSNCINGRSISDICKNTGIRHHEGKPRWDLLAYDVLNEMAVVMTEGAKKHGERDWEQGVSFNDYFSSAMRHLSAWHMGESMDTSGHNHLAHAMCNLMILLANEMRCVGTDDRPKIRRVL